MCGRYELHTPVGTLSLLFEFEAIPELKARYNIAPTQLVLAVRKKSAANEREGVLLRWGLIPSWAKDIAIGNSLINARGETVASKPSFRSAFKNRRCLILADGYYEWLKDGKMKRPFHFHRKDGKPFALAGLWEYWDKEGQILETCSIITTEANPLGRDIHDRMPVILRKEDYCKWLGQEAAPPPELQALLQPYPLDEFERCEVDTLVSSVKNDRKECILPKGA